MRVLLLALSCLVWSPIASVDAHVFCKEMYLRKRIPLTDKRHKTFCYALKEMTNRNVKVIVETGTARCGSKNCRGDGCSTVIFSDWAQQHNAHVYSVDINENALIEAERGIKGNEKYVTFVCKDSVDFLKNFNQLIDFLYLDSYDFEERNPKPSQEHHLKEIEAAYRFLHVNSIVMIDDCDLPNGGKGKLAIEYLKKKGWVVASEGYQVVMVFGATFKP